MKGRNLLNLLLLVVVVGLGLVAWLEPGREPPQQPKKITALEPAAIDRIRIERPADTLEMQRKDGKWMLTKPVVAPVNTVRSDAITSIAAIESLSQNPVQGLDLAKYGLDTPKARLWLNDTLVEFGGSTPLDNRRYVRVGDTLFLIPDLRYYQLIGQWTGYVSLRLLEEGVQLERVELPGLTLVNQEGSWRPQPLPAEWSADAATALVQHWQDTQAMEVHEYKEVARGEEVRLFVRGNSEPIRYIITSRTPELVMVRPDLGLSYTLMPERAAELLSLPPVKAETAGKPQ